MDLKTERRAYVTRLTRGMRVREAVQNVRHSDMLHSETMEVSFGWQTTFVSASAEPS
jgi:hypothetical protein